MGQCGVWDASECGRSGAERVYKDLHLAGRGSCYLLGQPKGQDAT